MKIRNYSPADLTRLQEIAKRYYTDEFNPEELEDKKFLHKFVVENDKNQIITAGGVRLIAESVAVTDKAFSPRERREALLLFLEASKFVTGRNGFDQLHAFVANDESWQSVLQRYGFTECKNKPFFMQVL